MKKKIIIIVTIIVLLLFFLKNCSFQIGNIHIGKKNDMLTKQISNFERSDFSRNYYKNNNLVVLNLWATWCQPCVEEIPLLNRIKDKNKLSKVDFISLSIDTDSTKLVKFNSSGKFKYKDITFQNLEYRNVILNTLDGKKGDDYIMTNSIPKTYLIKNNKVIKIINGMVNEAEIQNLIDKNK